MNVICTLDHKQLYEKALKEGIPFFQWHKWLEDTFNKEFLKFIIQGGKKKQEKTKKQPPKLEEEKKPRKSLIKEPPKTTKSGKTISFEEGASGLKSKLAKGLGFLKWLIT